MIKRRVLLFASSVFCFGAAVGLNLNYNPWYILIPLLGFVFVLILRYLKGRKVFCLIYLSILFCGIFASTSKIYKLEHETRAFMGQYVIIQGQISGDVVKEGGMSSYTVCVNTIEDNSNKYFCRYKIRVVDYNNPGDYIVPFNEVTMSGKLDRSRQYKNTGLFNYDEYLLRVGIIGVLDADYCSNIKSFISNKNPVMKALYNLREAMETSVVKYINPRTFQVFKGVLFGDTSSIDDSDVEAFKRSGIIHVFAVSGYNIWLIYYLLHVILFFLNKRMRVKTIIIIIMLGVYTLMSGSTPSVVRAFIMAGTICMGKLLKRQSDPLTSLAAAALLILVYNPLLIADTGFQLSFVSVASIVLLLPYLSRAIRVAMPEKIKGMILLTLSVQVGILPLIVYYYNSFPILSLLSNIIVVPLISIFTILSICIIPVSILYAGAASFAGAIMNCISEAVFAVTGFISSIPYSSINAVSPKIAEIALYYIIIGMLFKVIVIKGRYKRTAGFLAAAAVVLCITVDLLPSPLKISFIDVGQGDSILITTPDRKYVLIDGGGKPNTMYQGIDIGEDVLKPYLYKHRVSRIDLMISTHCHDDHLKGLIPVMGSFNVDKFVKTDSGDEQVYRRIEEEGLIDCGEAIDVSAGDIIQVGKYVKLYVLNPIEKEYDENDSSIVVRLVYKDFSALFTGDIGGDIERELTENSIRSDVLKIAHHGSSTSSIPEFIDTVKPRAAVICVGKNNFGHPDESVVKRIVDRGISLFRTDRDGEIIITTRGKGFKIKTAIYN